MRMSRALGLALGGVPITLDGKVVGAIGVSGDSPQIDEDIAIAGAKALP